MGKLTEDLLLMPDLEKLVHTSSDMGCSRLKDHSWYYAKLKVSILKLDQELMHSVAIPFILNKEVVAHQFKISVFPMR